LFGQFDHTGFLVRDLDAAVERAQRAFGLPLARTLELPQYGISAAFLGEGRGTLEIFTLADPQLREPRLGSDEQRIDHLGGSRHIWTLPESTAGLALQLIEAPAP
jgi:catechol 2,3-dioxygenase-like lactoylglutathione lyase family enzyme